MDVPLLLLHSGLDPFLPQSPAPLSSTPHHSIFSNFAAIPEHDAQNQNVDFPHCPHGAHRFFRVGFSPANRSVFTGKIGTDRCPDTKLTDFRKIYRK